MVGVSGKGKYRAPTSCTNTVWRDALTTLLPCRSWVGILVPLLPATAVSLSIGLPMARGSFGGALIVMAVSLSILTLISTMCGGLLGFLVVLSCYTPIVIAIVAIASCR